MKMILLIALCLFIGNSQDYISILDSIATWKFYSRMYQFELDVYYLQGLVYFMEGNTTVDGLEYSKLYAKEFYEIDDWSEEPDSFGNDYILVGGIREDSIKKDFLQEF